MNGQWIGDSSGTISGFVMLNLDLKDESYDGRLTLLNDDLDKVSIVAQVKINKNKLDMITGKFTGELFNILPINLENRRVRNWKEFLNISEEQISKTGEINGCLEGEAVNGIWNTDKGYKGEFRLKSKSLDKPSDYPSKEISWEEYKNEVVSKNIQYKKCIFRGQAGGKLWRLCTSFHRTGRADLSRYGKEDMRILYRYISAFPNCRFDLKKSGERGALLALAQHHGYPTPLLDWTRSPYVAAYFAYADLKKEESNKDGFVRIFIFDVDSWMKIKKYSLSLSAPLPTFTYLMPLSIGNNRMLPQQSVTMFSNIDDIESYIKFCQKQDRCIYLKVYDLPVRERTTVMQDLDYMGITASSLFPGLDGTCEALKEKYF